MRVVPRIYSYGVIISVPEYHRMFRGVFARKVSQANANAFDEEDSEITDILVWLESR